MDTYDYVMHGRIYSIKHIENQRIEIQASFGGLLLRLRGEQSQVELFNVDSMYVIVISFEFL
jgi:DNA-directed RNA polymerase I, II, and III subunit RPABC3